jgi:hypothetical protein
MQRPLGGWLLLAAALTSACTSLIGVAECADGTCPDGQTCDVGTHLCVQDLAPRITVLSPHPDAAVRDVVLDVRGTVTTTEGSTLVGMSYALGDGGVAGGVAVDGGLFAFTVPLPPLNAVDTSLVLLARDTEQRERRLLVPLWVDDVPPNPQFEPADGDRGTDNQLTVDFGEMVSGAPAPVLLNPPALGGAFDSAGRRYTVSGLAYDTGYTVSVDAALVTDGIGNPNLGGSARFWTAAKPPTTGIIAGLGAVVDFDASSDEDGVVTLAIETSNKVVWGWYRPSDGQFAQLNLLDIPNPPLPYLRIVSGYQVKPDFTPQRVSAVLQEPALATWRSDVRVGTTFSTATATAVVPTGPSCAEPGASPDSVGLINSAGMYSRDGYTHSLGFIPDALAVRSPDFWVAVFKETLVGVTYAWYQAHCGSSPDAGIRMESVPQSDVADNQFSLALTRADRSLLVFNRFDGLGLQRLELCRSCAQFPDAGDCPAQVKRVASGAVLTVASKHEGGRVLGARQASSLLLELLERDLTTDCNSSWTVLATVPDSSSATKWLPVMFGRKPGIVYSTATDVRVYVP